MVQKIPFKIKKMQNCYLWGTTFTNEQAYDHILNNGEHFEFCFKRLFENENKIVVYQNLGIDKILEFKDKLHLLRKYPKEEWEQFFEIYKEYYKDIKKRELANEYEV